MKIENFKLKIIFFGTPQFVIPVLEILVKNHDVVAVVTTTDQPTGRKQILTPSPVKNFALQHNIPVIDELKIENFKPVLSLSNGLKIASPDLFVVAAYGKLIRQEILDMPKFGAINIHPSLLPKYRGPSPLQAAILNGDQETGISFMKMDAEMDHGPIIEQTTYELNQTETFESLANKIFTKAADLLPGVIDKFIADPTSLQEQNHSQATYTKHVEKNDGYIDANNPLPSDKLDSMIRAHYPWPTVWTKLKINNQEKIVKLLPSLSLRGADSDEAIPSHERYLIQVEGKKPVSVIDFLNGYPEMKERLKKIFIV